MMNTKPLITFTTHALAGGIGRTIVNLANTFVDLGYPVHLLLDEPLHLYGKSLIAGIETFHLRTSHIVGGVVFLGNYIRRHRPSVLITPVVRHTILAVRTRNLLKTQTKVFPVIHNSYSRSFWTLSPRKKHRRIKKIMKYYPQCDGIIAVSRGVADDLCALTKLPEERVKTLYNAVVTEELEKSALEQVDHPWFAPGEPPVIISVGRLHYQKNYPLLIKSFELVRRHTCCRLMIIGDGGERETLDALPVHQCMRMIFIWPVTRITPLLMSNIPLPSSFPPSTRASLQCSSKPWRWGHLSSPLIVRAVRRRSWIMVVTGPSFP